MGNVHKKVWGFLQQIENEMRKNLPDQGISFSNGYTSSKIHTFFCVCETKKKGMYIIFIIKSFENQKISTETIVKDERPHHTENTFETYDELKYIFKKEKENFATPYFMFMNSFQSAIKETFRLESLLKDNFLENKTEHLVPYLK